MSREFQVLEDRRYTESDEWIHAAGNVVRVGITDYAQEELSDVVFVELPAPGTRVAIGESFGVIESVKAVADLYAPVSGEVLAVNETLADQPELVNEDPFGRGWLIEIRASDLAPLENLLDAAAYRARVAERAGK